MDDGKCAGCMRATKSTVLALVVLLSPAFVARCMLSFLASFSQSFMSVTVIGMPQLLGNGSRLLVKLLMALKCAL